MTDLLKEDNIDWQYDNEIEQYDEEGISSTVWRKEGAHRMGRQGGEVVFLHCGCVRWIATKTHDETPQKLQMKYLKNYK